MNLPDWQKWDKRERRKKAYTKYNRKPEAIVRHIQWTKEYRQKPEVRIREKEYRQTSKYKTYQKEYYQRPEVKEKMREYFRQWVKRRRKTNIQVRLTHRLRNRLRESLKNYGEGKKMHSKEYGVDWTPAIRKLVETKPADFGERKYDIDHVKPVSSFDLTNTEQVRQAFAPDNLQWLEAKENRRKGNKMIK
jgi:hypothetical protein